MKSIVSSLVLTAILVSTAVNAIPIVEGATPSGAVRAGSSTKQGSVTPSEKKVDSSLTQSGAHKPHALSNSKKHTATTGTTSTTRHKSKKDKQKDKKRTRKHRKTQGEETEKQSKSDKQSKSKSHVPAPHNTPSASRTETSAQLSKSKSESQPRDVVELEDVLYARGKSNSKKKAAKKTKKDKKSKKNKQHQQESSDVSQDDTASTMTSMVTREVDDVLEARLFNLGDKMREAKARRLRKAADKAQAEADAAAIKAGLSPKQKSTPSEAPERVSRDFFEEEFEARDIAEEELELRDLTEEELEARSFADFWRGLTHKETPKEKAERLQHKANRLAKEADAAEAAAGKRDFIDEELELREFDEAEGLLAREYFDDDELAARAHTFWETLNTIQRTFTPKAAGAPKAPASVPAPADGDTSARELFEEFDLRDLFEIDELD